VRHRFLELLDATGHAAVTADVKVLCVHHCIEGSRVEGYTFRSGDDVIRAADLPVGFAAVLSGHIHRHQVLRTDLSGRPLAVPVLYPGSTERTSFAERHETKGYLLLSLEPSPGGGALQRWEFGALPTRPMLQRDVDAHELDSAALECELRQTIAAVPPDAVLKVRLVGIPLDDGVLRAAKLRSLAPPTMNLTVTLPEEMRRHGRRGGRDRLFGRGR